MQEKSYLCGRRKVQRGSQPSEVDGMASSDDSDEELVRRWQLGERRVFDELVSRYRKALFRTAYRTTGDVDEAEEIVQEVLLRCFRGLASFHHAASLATWLYRITWNLCADWRRRARRRSARLAPSAAPEEIIDATQNVESGVLEETERESLARAVAALDERYRSSIVLFYEAGLSHGEIAKITGVSARTVETRLYRARRALRTILVGEDRRRGRAGGAPLLTDHEAQFTRPRATGTLNLRRDNGAQGSCHER